MFGSCRLSILKAVVMLGPWEKRLSRSVQLYSNIVEEELAIIWSMSSAVALEIRRQRIQ